MPPPRWQPTNFNWGNFSNTPRTIMREIARHSSKGRPTLDARRYSRMRSSPKPTDCPVHHHRAPKPGDQPEKWPSLIVVGIGALMARVDEHALQAAFNDRSLKLFQKRLSAAGQGTSKNHDPVAMLVLNLG